MSEETNTSRPADAGDAGGSRGGFQRDKDTPEGGRKGRRRRKVSYLTLNKIYTVDFKEINILRRFLNDRGKILPSRQSGNTASQQRMISTAIRRAREMALLPFTVTEMSTDRREYGGRERRYPRPERNDSHGHGGQQQTTEEPKAVEAPVAAEAPKAAKAPKVEKPKAVEAATPVETAAEAPAEA